MAELGSKRSVAPEPMLLTTTLRHLTLSVSNTFFSLNDASFITDILTVGVIQVSFYLMAAEDITGF